ncbi:hypothetical protein F4824DRAFT_497206 [Ustulina deusta]|nr:hypothetical protein F4824DRAFT_497206 [Ustulina deusta]
MSFDDGREPELLRVILHHPSVNQLWGNSRKVLDVIDEFGRTRKYLMNISACNKSKTIVDLIKALKLQVLAEIGECVDYSAIVSRYCYKILWLDHYKSLYTDELKICEELGMIKVATVLAANNGE